MATPTETFETNPERPAVGDDASAIAATDTTRDRLVGQLTGGVAHDFNNMLATVLGCLELMERRVGDAERLRTLIQRATDAVERSAQLTAALTEFAARRPEPPRTVAISDVVGRSLPLITSALGRRVRLETKLAPSLPPVRADLTALQSVVLAITLAARRGLPQGGRVTIVTDMEDGDAGAVRIGVTAEGEGQIASDLDIVRALSNTLGARLDSVGDAGGGRLEVCLRLPTASPLKRSPTQSEGPKRPA